MKIPPFVMTKCIYIHILMFSCFRRASLVRISVLFRGQFLCYTNLIMARCRVEDEWVFHVSIPDNKAAEGEEVPWDHGQCWACTGQQFFLSCTSSNEVQTIYLWTTTSQSPGLQTWWYQLYLQESQCGLKVSFTGWMCEFLCINAQDLLKPAHVKFLSKLHIIE